MYNISSEIFLLIFLVSNISLIFFCKFSKILLDNPSHGIHKNKFNKGIPLTGGAYFFICIILIFLKENNLIITKSYFIFFFLILILGFLSDSYKNMSPRVRLIIQITIIISFVYFLKIKIDKTSLSYLDFLIKNNFINLAFTTFCLLVLLNGSNFCDGINLNVTGYYLIVFICLIFLDINNSEFNVLSLIIFALIIFYISNLFNFCFLGDNGVYLISLFSGIYVINFINSEQTLNPLIAINLLWYPAYENLFTIIRRKIKKNKVDHADTKHLHILFKNFLSKKIDNFKYINSLSGFILNLFILIGLSMSVIYRNNSYALLSIVIINLIIYNFVYFKLRKDSL